MMQRFMAILLAVGFAALPIRLIASENSGCVASACESVLTGACSEVAPSCCDWSEQSEDAPADPESERGGECDCPLTCCGMVKTIAVFTIKPNKDLVPYGAEHPDAAPQVVCGSPHINRLKRPPRPLTIAA